MFIKVTNSFFDKKGDILVININSIVSVYEEHIDGGSLSTVIYSSPQLLWHVEESVEVIYKKIIEALGK